MSYRPYNRVIENATEAGILQDVLDIYDLNNMAWWELNYLADDIYRDYLSDAMVPDPGCYYDDGADY